MAYDMKLCKSCQIDFKKYYEKYRTTQLYYIDPDFHIIKNKYKRNIYENKK